MVVPEILYKKSVIKKSTNNNYSKNYLNADLPVIGFFYLYEHMMYLSKTKKGYAVTEPRSGFTITGYEEHYKTLQELFNEIEAILKKHNAASHKKIEVAIEKAILSVYKRKIICFGTYLSL